MRVVARVAVTLTGKHSDGGWSTREAENLVYSAVTGAPPAAHIRLDVGPVQYPSRRMIDLLRQAVGPEAILVIEGSAENVNNWIEEFAAEPAVKAA